MKGTKLTYFLGTNLSIQILELLIRSKDEGIDFQQIIDELNMSSVSINAVLRKYMFMKIIFQEKKDRNEIYKLNYNDNRLKKLIELYEVINK